ncbi:MAG TPA: pantoate--beta-alanine ligase [Coriobacteriia bacterium]|jgi:pantoate--beta-alanine ligase
MERVVSAEEVRQALGEAKRDGMSVALVPTMGALHEGHLALVRAARARADLVVVSVFVNPAQFGPGEDFEAYPRDIPHDLELLAAEDVDVVFTPSVEAMYPPGTESVVEPGSIALLWEGESRPGHFAGVCTIVAKLFNIVGPDIAFFGEKDYQQLVVIRRMVRDLDFGVRVVGVPIVRDRDGLALSSRNAYLTAEQRRNALVLSRALEAVRQQVSAGERDAVALARFLAEEIQGGSLAELDYAAVVDPDSLEQLELLDRPSRAIVAARFGRARLIDNVAIGLAGDGRRHLAVAGEATCETTQA